jgi:hypothetical protein
VLRLALRAGLFTTNIIERTWAIVELARVPDPATVRALSEVLEDPEGALSLSATERCAELLGLDDALQVYKAAMLSARSFHDRQEAIKALSVFVRTRVTGAAQ